MTAPFMNSFRPPGGLPGSKPYLLDLKPQPGLQTTPTAQAGSGFAAGDWASLISGLGHGAASAFQPSTYQGSRKKDMKENKRRTMANLLNQAIRTDQGMFRAGQQYEDELRDYQSQAMQQIARGFANALAGSTRG